jgi:hypothetical protein
MDNKRTIDKERQTLARARETIEAIGERALTAWPSLKE